MLGLTWKKALDGVTRLRFANKHLESIVDEAEVAMLRSPMDMPETVARISSMDAETADRRVLGANMAIVEQQR